MFRFPHPTGHHGVGTVTYHWLDADRPEVFTADPDDRRELMVQLWYPVPPDPAAPRAPYVQVPGMFHADMTDVPSWSPAVARLGLSGPIGVQRAHRIVNAYSLAFFDRHLKGRPAALLDGPAAQYPEVRFEARRP